MTPKRSKYTTEFKAQAIKKIAENNGNITQTAKELGIPMNTLNNWNNKASSVSIVVMRITISLKSMGLLVL